ncbi:hypothetical protein E2562_005528 [Oryza meyeriana var. granulata]|uniref:Uncharacterized protein n=1 Tax=Oryza meyeriana var. granulata TaxID=110450 RepID=A0A6G1F3R7_9ORYZ|nr:hypothetical protein E2562_005528 [Oryza meyeriana var. granulata]
MSICERVETPRGGGTLGKRKERERSSSEQQRAPPPLFPAVSAKPQPPRPAQPNRFVKPMPPPPPPPFPKGGGSSFKLLAGYLAHEFLKSGTLLGERPESSSKGPAAASAGEAPDPRTRYAEASFLLMAGGARVPGVVNPTQLGHWLRIKE